MDIAIPVGMSPHHVLEDQVVPGPMKEAAATVQDPVGSLKVGNNNYEVLQKMQQNIAARIQKLQTADFTPLLTEEKAALKDALTSLEFFELTYKRLWSRLINTNIQLKKQITPEVLPEFKLESYVNRSVSERDSIISQLVAVYERIAGIKNLCYKVAIEIKKSDDELALLVAANQILSEGQKDARSELATAQRKKVASTNPVRPQVYTSKTLGAATRYEYPLHERAWTISPTSSRLAGITVGLIGASLLLSVIGSVSDVSSKVFFVAGLGTGLAAFSTQAGKAVIWMLNDLQNIKV